MPADRKRRRTINSCTECYSRKQKCDHALPCQRCLKRRQPELCRYHTSDPCIGASDPKVKAIDATPRSGKVQERSSEKYHHAASIDWPNLPAPSPGLPTSLGHEDLDPYLKATDDCNSYLPSFLEKFDALKLDATDDAGHTSILGRYSENNELDLNLGPQRPIFDALVQNYFCEVDWMYAIPYPPAFMMRYDLWWRSPPNTSIESLEFCALLLRLAAYSAQYVPSKTIPKTNICGEECSSIRDRLFSLANRLSRVFDRIPGPRSLTWVNQLFFKACYLTNKGSMPDAWHAFSEASQASQDLNLHRELPESIRIQVGEFEAEMRRRTFWNMYYWDRLLSIILERMPCIAEEYIEVHLPKMRLVPGTDDPGMPDLMDERTVEVRLLRLWWSTLPANKSQPEAYNPATAEQRYLQTLEMFSTEIPAIFKLREPLTKWDKQLPKLVRQRLCLRITLAGILCHQLRLVLHLDPAELAAMSHTEQKIVDQHRIRLVRLGISALQDEYKFHELMGNAKINLFIINFFFFEPARMLGLHILSEQTTYKHSPVSQIQDTSGLANSFALPSFGVTAAECRTHIENALIKLISLSEVSKLALVGSRLLRTILHKVNSITESTTIGGAKSLSSDLSCNQEGEPAKASTIAAKDESGYDLLSSLPSDPLQWQETDIASLETATNFSYPWQSYEDTGLSGYSEYPPLLMPMYGDFMPADAAQWSLIDAGNYWDELNPYNAG